ncbi:MAG: PilZ domain-containing protein [Pseudomonadota bacterium]
MRAKNDPWRYSNELVALGVIVIITSFAVTLLAVARRAGEGGETFAAPEPASDVAGSTTPESIAIVLGVAALTGLLVFAAQVAKERRGAKRYACRLPCHVAFAGENFRARMVNISETGAQLKTKGYALREGDRLHLSVADARMEALVMWTGSGRVGVRFASRLDYDSFRAVLRRARERGALQRVEAPEVAATGPAAADVQPVGQSIANEKAPAPEAREPSILRIEPTPTVRRPLS